METSWTPEPECAPDCRNFTHAHLPYEVPTTFRDAWSSDPDRTTRKGDTRTAEQVTRDMIEDAEWDDRLWSRPAHMD